MIAARTLQTILHFMGPTNPSIFFLSAFKKNPILRVIHYLCVSQAFIARWIQVLHSFATLLWVVISRVILWVINHLHIYRETLDKLYSLYMPQRSYVWTIMLCTRKFFLILNWLTNPETLYQFANQITSFQISRE